ncbi:HD domain-containing phosphohydrolase [Marinobacter fonticola]|uniref:HD domain-containing phosphohydrolase n=1 Tax=Marinobacter fonticola TaxID=2603215 RepID=UPI0011E7B697|nr:HD domain-containing phosphohydrolase [Marinobacter fonticola]
MTRDPKRYPLALLTSLAITLGMLILTLTLIYQAHRGMEAAKLRATSDSVEDLVFAVNDRIRSLTEPPVTALLLLRGSTLAQAETLDERLEHLDVLADILRINHIVDAAYMGYPNGEFFLLRRMPEDDTFLGAPGATQFVLQTITLDENNQLKAELHFYSSRLDLLERRANPDTGYAPQQHNWYQKAAGTNDIALTDPYVFYTTSAVGLTLARKAADTPAVAGIDVTVSALSSQLEALKLTANTEIAIVDREGTVIAYPDPSRMMAGPDHTPQLAYLEQLDVPALDRVRAMPVSTEARQFSIADGEWFGISAALRPMHGAGLQMLIAIPADELLADAWSLVRQQLWIALGLVLVLLVLGWRLGRQLGKPLEQLATEVGELSRFRFDTPISTESRIREAHGLGLAIEDMAGTIRSFQSISTTLNRSQNLDALLHGILNELISILNEKRGAIYLFRQPLSQLELAVSVGPERTAVIDGIAQHQTDTDITRDLRQRLTDHAVYAVLRNRTNELVGVLLIDLDEAHFGALDENTIRFVNEIAGSAAVAIETRQLIEGQQRMIEGVIRLIADAIDAKSAYTSGHCERVPKLAKMIVDKAIDTRSGPFTHFEMTEWERYEFHIAAWLHDCGKITSPEYVVDKATKLETIYNRLHEIRTRFEVLHRDLEIDYLNRRLAGEDDDQARPRKDALQAELQADFQFLAQTNIGGEAMDDSAVERVVRIGDRRWLRYFSDRLGLSHDERARHTAEPEPALPVEETLLADKQEHIVPWDEGRKPPVARDDPRNRWGFDMALPDTAYNYGERYNLTIRRGTLTPEERFKINEHIVQTIIMLDELPLPDRLSKVPRLAGTHHEKVDGTGYPRQLPGEALSVPEKAMVIADIFEALTAVDRPYKEGKTLTQALGIMRNMAREGHVDPAMFNLFLQSGVYLDYARGFLGEQQIDEVDVKVYTVAES